MIGARTSVKLLMRLGIALIFAPEPFTTPFGVALVLAARYLSRRREASLNKRLRETVTYYLAHTRQFSDDADVTSSVSGSVRHIQGKEHAILGQITGRPGFKANAAPSARQNWHDIQRRTVHHTMNMQSFSGRYKSDDSFKVESSWFDTSCRAEKVIHHTVNVEWLSRRYESADCAVAHSNWACTSGAVEGVTHHSVNMKSLSQRYNTGSVGETKAKYHTINMALFMQHHGSLASHTRALNTLQNNNYYDIVCRGNVIGGY